MGAPAKNCSQKGKMVSTSVDNVRLIKQILPFWIMVLLFTLWKVIITTTMMMNMVGWGGVRLWRVTVRPNDHIRNISNRCHFLVFYPQQIVDCTDLISDHCYCYCYCYCYQNLSQWSHREYLKWQTDSIHLCTVLISGYCTGMNITFTYWSDFFAHYRKPKVDLA